MDKTQKIIIIIFIFVYKLLLVSDILKVKYYIFGGDIMTKLHEIYKCAICGNIVEVTHASGGQLVCCGQPMTLQKENTVDASKEKHIPVVEKRGNEVLIKVGSVDHPMEEKHYIEWIEIETTGGVYKKFLNPGEKPEAIFKIEDDIVCARAYCNIHGLWKYE